MNRTVLNCVLLALTFGAVLFLGLQGITAPPAFDDEPQIDHVLNFKSPSQCFGADCFGLFRPVKNIIFWFVTHRGESRTVVGHGLSIVLYLIATGLVFLWLRSRFGSDSVWPAAGVAIWALAPTQVSSLVWLSCANILVAVIGVILTLLLWEWTCRLLEAGNTGTGIVAAVLCGCAFLVACLAYQMAVMVPILVVFRDWVDGRPLVRRRVLVGYMLLGAVTVACLGWSVVNTPVSGPGNPGFSPMSNAKVSFASAFFLVDHLRLWFLPFGRQEILATFVWNDSSPPTALLAAAWAVPVLIAAIVVGARRRAPDISFGLGWFLITFLPVSNLVPLRVGPFADYYLVLPGVGLALAGTAFLRWVFDAIDSGAWGPGLRRSVFAGLALTFILSRVAAVCEGVRWCGNWRNPLALCAVSMEVRPFAFRAKATLAQALKNNGDLATAESIARAAHDEAPWFSTPMHILGDIRNLKGDHVQAADWFRRSIAICPSDAYPHYALAYTSETWLHDTHTAKQHYALLLATRNTYRENAAVNLSRILGLEGKHAQVIRLLERELRESRPSAAIHHNLAIAYSQVGRTADADRHRLLAQRLFDQPAAH